MNSERELRSEFRHALDVVLPPAAWLEATIAEDLRKRRQRLPRAAMPLMAGVLTVALAIAATGVVLAIHNSLSRQAPVKPHSVTTPWTPRQGGFQTRCSGTAPTCPLFISEKIGWVVESAGSHAFGNSNSFGPFSLYGTSDGGRHWAQRLTWTCPAPTQILASADGREGLLVAFSDVPSNQPRACSGAIFRTTDRGDHWQPLSIGLLAQQVSKDIWGRPDIFFLNPHEGWGRSTEPLTTGPVMDDIIHTTDSGAHWTLQVRTNWQATFGVGWGGNGGQLAFQDSRTGFFLPPPSTHASDPQLKSGPPFFFVTHDSGANWQIQHLPVPPGSQVNAGDALFVPYMSADVASGVLEVLAEIPATAPVYIYTAVGGPEHWSFSVALPAALDRSEVHFIDTRHWIGRLADGSLVRTDDGGKHWSQITSVFPRESVSVGIDPFHFVDAAHGWTVLCPNVAIGPDPLATVSCLSTTSDGGAHWTSVEPPTR